MASGHPGPPFSGGTFLVGPLIAVGAALTLLAGCGGSSSSSSSKSSSGGGSSSGVTLSVSGARGNLNASACGKQEAFYDYGAPAHVSYSGTVSPAPSGRWKLKIKLKRCVGNAFTDADAQKIVGQNDGRFSGVFAIPAKGSYSLRARLEGHGRTESEKVYVQVQ
jgi:hypothetical protein